MVYKKRGKWIQRHKEEGGCDVTFKEKAMWRQKQRLEQCVHKSRNAGNPKSQQDTRKHSPLEPLERAWPCWCLDFRHVAVGIGKNKCPLFKPPSLWCFATTALANQFSLPEAFGKSDNWNTFSSLQIGVTAMSGGFPHHSKVLHHLFLELVSVVLFPRLLT